MKKVHKKSLTILAVLISIFVVFNIVHAVGTTPGSEDDPIITVSYLEKKLQELMDSFQKMDKSLETAFDQKLEHTASNMTVLDQKVEELRKVAGGGSTFKVVTVPAGKKMICGESTEVILRAGQAEAVSQNSSGISDVTMGKDIQSGQNIDKDHLLIVPRADGRGVLAVKQSIFMVKGSYEVE